jgi:hypothetical protein
VTTGLTSAIASGGTLSVTLAKLTNPPSARKFYNFNITTTDTYGNMIDYKYNSSLSVGTANSFGSSSAISMVTDDGVSATAVTYDFLLYTANPIPTGGKIIITLPTNITIDSTIFSLTCVSTNCDTTLSAASTVYSSAANTVTISGIFAQYIDFDTEFHFTLSGFTNSPNTDAINITVASYD